MQERDAEVLREVAAEFLAREAGPQSLITVTRATVAEDRSRGTVYITVLPESEEGKAVAFANRHVEDLYQLFQKRVRGMRLPRVEFVIDLGEKNRQRLDELSE